MRCNFCGTELTTGGCPRWDCPSKRQTLSAQPIAPTLVDADVVLLVDGPAVPTVSADTVEYFIGQIDGSCETVDIDVDDWKRYQREALAAVEYVAALKVPHA